MSARQDGLSRSISDSSGTLGYGSSGTSPGATPIEPTKSTKPTLHLIGVGPVGRQFLAQLDTTLVTLVGVTDSTATVHDRAGLSATQIAAHKAAGGTCAQLEGAESLPSELAVELVAADIVVDATRTEFRSPGPALRRCSAALRTGAHLVLASKHALCAAAPELLALPHGERIGYSAVLGGTGRALRHDRDLLRRARSIALVPNASTTTVLQAVERGATLDAGIALAQARGLLEADPSLDLDGSDALGKLVIVAGALWGVSPTAAVVTRTDLRALDLDVVRARHAEGLTTRLVARGTPDGLLQVDYEAVDRSSPLWTPPDRVVYAYQSNASRHLAAGWRVHVGHGVGPVGTAQALHDDVRDFVALRGAR
jgi:homoserine dehydrogenase